MKRRLRTGSIDGRLGLGEGARESNVVVFAIRGTQGSGRRPAGNAAAHGLVSFPQSTTDLIEAGVAFRKSC